VSNKESCSLISDTDGNIDRISRLTNAAHWAAAKNSHLEVISTFPDWSSGCSKLNSWSASMLTSYCSSTSALSRGGEGGNLAPHAACIYFLPKPGTFRPNEHSDAYYALSNTGEWCICLPGARLEICCCDVPAQWPTLYHTFRENRSWAVCTT